MSKPVFIGSHVEYHDYSREYNIDARGRDISEILRACNAEDITPVQEQQPDDKQALFKHLTQKCIQDKQVEAVDAEIRAACKGTAEGLWRTLWNNENLGYVVVQPIDATTLYRDIENHYGKLPYKERNFRDARSKR